jgi:hypothetical protein
MMAAVSVMFSCSGYFCRCDPLNVGVSHRIRCVSLSIKLTVDQSLCIIEAQLSYRTTEASKRQLPVLN